MLWPERAMLAAVGRIQAGMPGARFRFGRFCKPSACMYSKTQTGRLQCWSRVWSWRFLLL